MSASRQPGYWQQLPEQLAFGIPGNLISTLVSAAVRVLIAQYRSRRSRIAFIRNLEQRSGVNGLNARQLRAAFAHPQFTDMLVVGDLMIANQIVAPLIPDGTSDGDVLSVSSAFVYMCREAADPVVRAVVASHDSLISEMKAARDSIVDELTAGMTHLGDRGISGGDPQIPTILSNLDDPAMLSDRALELATLHLLVQEPGDYEAIVAPAYTGKSTLLAYFAAHPPPEADVVSFFTARRLGRNTVNAFLDVVNGQLRHLVDKMGPEVGDTNRRIYYFDQLWAEAVELAAGAPRQLLLIVDGLDEQEDTSPSISSLLPAPISEHVTVIVSSRPNPAEFVLRSARHPLAEKLARPWLLEPTKETTRRLDLAKSEMRESFGLISGSSAVDTLQRDVLAALACARSSLDARSIAEIARRDEHDVAMWLAQSNLVVRVGGAGPNVFELGHEIFYAVVKEQIRLEPWDRRLRDWVQSYAARGWPDDTPTFILYQFPGTLELESLSLLVTSEFRARVRAELGSEHHLVSAIQTAVASHLDKSSAVDLAAVGRLTLHRLEIISRRSDTPVTLIRAHIADGRTDYAYRLARELRVSLDRALALTAAAAATSDRYEQASRWKDAEQAVADVSPGDRTEACIAFVNASPPAALLARLEAAAGELDPFDRARVFVAIANASPSQRDRLLRAAEMLAAGLGSRNRAKVLIDIANANRGEQDRLLQSAEALAADLAPLDRAEILIQISNADPSQRDRLLDVAESALTEAPPADVDVSALEPAFRARVLVEIAKCRSGERDRLLYVAEAMVSDATVPDLDPGARAFALLAIAEANPPAALLARLEAAAANVSPGFRTLLLVAIATANPQERERLLSAAEAAASRPEPEHPLRGGLSLATTRVEVLRAFANASPAGGLLSRLEAAAAELEPRDRAEVLVAFADTNPAERERLLEAAEAAASEFAPSVPTRTLVNLATATATTNERNRLLAAAEEAASDVGTWNRPEALIEIAEASTTPYERARRFQAAEAAEAVAVATGLDPWYHVSFLVKLARANPADRDRLLDAAYTAAATLEPGYRGHLLLEIAKARPQGPLQQRLEAAAAEIPAGFRPQLFVELSYASPSERDRLLDAAEAALPVAGLEPWARTRLLLEIAKLNPGDRDRLLDAAEEAAAEAAWDHRVRLFIAIAKLNPRDRDRLLATAEESAADVAPDHRAHLLIAIAEANPPERDRLLAAAEEAATELDPWDRAAVLAELAKTSASPTERARLLGSAEAVVTEVDVTRTRHSFLDRTPFPARALIDIAKASPGDEDRLLAAAETSVIDLDPSARVRVLIESAKATPTGRERRLARALATVQQIDEELLTAVANLAPGLWPQIVDVVTSLRVERIRE